MKKSKEKIKFRNCKICGTQFYAKPFTIKHGWGLYCSKKCQYISFQKGKVVHCEICKKEVYKSLQALKHSKSKKYFCSKSCQTKWRNTQFVGEKHLGWKDGTSTYRDVLLRNKVIQICKLCKTEDKRILAVHHVDKNRKNISLDNLVWLCHNCHHLIHQDKVEMQGFMRLLR